MPPLMHFHHVLFLQCSRPAAKSAHRLAGDPVAGFDREVAGYGTAAAGFGSPEAGNGRGTSGLATQSTTPFKPPEAAAGPSSAPLSSGKTLPEGLVLGLTGLIDKQPANQPRVCTGGGTQSGIPADGSKYGSDAGARSSAGQRALLRWRHIGAGSELYRDGREQEKLFHGVLHAVDQRDAGHG